MKKYEIAFIVGENFTEDKAKEVAVNIRKLFEDNGAKIEKDFYWGKRKLVYKIAKNTFGYYFILIFELNPTKIAHINHELQFNDKILRYLLVDFIEKSPFFELDAEKDKKSVNGKSTKKPASRKTNLSYQDAEASEEDESIKQEIKESTKQEEIKEEKTEKIKEIAQEPKIIPEEIEKENEDIKPTKEKEEDVTPEIAEETKEIEPEEEKVEEVKEEPVAEDKKEEEKPKVEEEPEPERKTAIKMTDDERKKQLDDKLAELLKDEEL